MSTTNFLCWLIEDVNTIVRIIGLACASFGSWFLWLALGNWPERWGRRAVVGLLWGMAGVVFLFHGAIMMLTGMWSIFHYSASLNSRSEDIRVVPMIVAELKLRDIKNGFFGRKHTLETIAKIRAASIAQHRGNK